MLLILLNSFADVSLAMLWQEKDNATSRARSGRKHVTACAQELRQSVQLLTTPSSSRAPSRSGSERATALPSLGSAASEMEALVPPARLTRQLSFVAYTIDDVDHIIQSEKEGGVEWFRAFWHVVLVQTPACRMLTNRSLPNWVAIYNRWQATAKSNGGTPVDVMSASELQDWLAAPPTRVVEIVRLFDPKGYAKFNLMKTSSEHSKIRLPILPLVCACVMMSQTLTNRQKLRFLFGIFDKEDKDGLTEEEFISMLQNLLRGLACAFGMAIAKEMLPTPSKVHEVAKQIFSRMRERAPPGEASTSFLSSSALDHWILGHTFDPVALPFALFLERYSIDDDAVDPDLFQDEPKRFRLSHAKPVENPLEAIINVDPNYLSRFEAQLKNVHQIQATRDAFAAILVDGSVVTWGHASSGGDSSAVRAQLKSVQQIQAYASAFADLLCDGSVVPWGDEHFGGDSRAAQVKLKTVLQTDGSVVTWGDANSSRRIRRYLGDAYTGGDSSAVHDQLNVQQIQTTAYAFAAILGDGSIVAWDDAGQGCDGSAVQHQVKNVQQIQATHGSFAAVLGDGSVVTWGDERFGGDSTAVQDQLKTVQQIQATDSAFAAILGDRSVVTWGRSHCGGDSSSVQAQLQNVQQIQASMRAFAAILGDGSVVTWGDADSDGDSSSECEAARQVKCSCLGQEADKKVFGNSLAAELLEHGTCAFRAAMLPLIIATQDRQKSPSSSGAHCMGGRHEAQKPSWGSSGPVQSCNSGARFASGGPFVSHQVATVVLTAREIFQYCQSISDFKLTHEEVERGVQKPISVEMWCGKLSRALEEMDSQRGTQVRSDLVGFLRKLCPKATPAHIRMYQSWLQEFDSGVELKKALDLGHTMLQIYQSYSKKPVMTDRIRNELDANFAKINRVQDRITTADLKAAMEVGTHTAKSMMQYFDTNRSLIAEHLRFGVRVLFDLRPT
eukprot:s2614_g4.t1